MLDRIRRQITVLHCSFSVSARTTLNSTILAALLVVASALYRRPGRRAGKGFSSVWVSGEAIQRVRARAQQDLRFSALDKAQFEISNWPCWCKRVKRVRVKG